MLDRFKAHIAHSFPFLKKNNLLIACSGGVDSMVLAHLALQSGFQFSLAHCNYKLRGEASDLDEALVKRWASENGKQLFLNTVDLSKEVGSIQLKARGIRYDWFQELVKNQGFNFILTAHHLDDNLETFLINLSRGTGLDGLTGIPQINQNVIRPLSSFTKDDILNYAISEGVPWREDESNKELKYLRNRIRHNIVPKLLEINPSFLSNFQRTQEYLEFSNQMLDDYGIELRERLFIKSGNHIHISIASLEQLKPRVGYLRLLFKSFGFTQWDDLANLLETQSGKEIRSKSHRIIKDREQLILTALFEPNNEEYHIDITKSEWKGPIYLKIEAVDSLGIVSSKTIYLDKEKLNYPLKLRKWKIGDYFYPLGMDGKKKLSKFFKDEKYSAIQKEDQWLLCCNNDIVWILGKRMDDRFKVDQQTKGIIKISWGI